MLMGAPSIRPACEKCGFKLAKSHKFCPECGAPRTGEDEASDPATAGRATSQMAPPRREATRTVAPSRGSSSGAVVPIITGGIAVVLGIVALLYADAHKPTIENALIQGEVLKPSTYHTLVALGWVLVVGGAIAVIVGFIQMQGRPNQIATSADPQPPSVRGPAGSTRPCQNCGTEIDWKYQVCGQCGTVQTPPGRGPDSSQASSPVAPSSAQSLQTGERAKEPLARNDHSERKSGGRDNVFCENCGRKLISDDQFCHGCGAKQPL